VSVTEAANATVATEIASPDGTATKNQAQVGTKDFCPDFETSPDTNRLVRWNQPRTNQTFGNQDLRLAVSDF
jgi:hypothetical protein